MEAVALTVPFIVANIIRIVVAFVVYRAADNRGLAYPVLWGIGVVLNPVVGGLIFLGVFTIIEWMEIRSGGGDV